MKKRNKDHQMCKCLIQAGDFFIKSERLLLLTKFVLLGMPAGTAVGNFSIWIWVYDECVFLKSYSGQICVILN